MPGFAELTVSPERTAAFEYQLQQTLNRSSLSLMILLGYRTGLWDVLRQLDHATSREIAEQAGLQEAPVADWLATMLSGNIIEFDPIFQTYRLPREHASVLCGDAGSTQYTDSLKLLTLFAQHEAELTSCFQDKTKQSEGELADLLSEQRAIQTEPVTNRLFQQILPLVPGLIMRLCDGSDVLELGCGDGTLLLELARAFPQSNFVGYDPSEELIEQARQAAAKLGLENVSFMQRELTQIHAINAFDLITAFDVMDQRTDPSELLDAVQTALRPEGTLLIQNLAFSRNRECNLQHPLSALLYTISSFRNLTTPDNRLATYWHRGQEAICQGLEEAGFVNVENHSLSQDLLHEYFVAQSASVTTPEVISETAF